MHTLLLFDIDSVLLHPVGYKTALPAMVNYFARQMALPDMGPDDNEIGVFEACGLTNEWDSGALCVTALLMAALASRPDLCRDTLDETLAAVGGAGLSLERPDFAGFAREIARRGPNGHLPASVWLAMVAERVDAAHLPLFSALLHDVYDINTPTTRIFQTLTLGSDNFARTYGQPAPFDSVSYLKEYDVSLIDAGQLDRLRCWRDQPGHGAALFTARPSLPPADLPGDVPHGYPPEAELAVDLLGLRGVLPLIASGRVSWLAHQNGRRPAEYVKPSPVQALAAIGAAFSNTESPALLAAADLVERGTLSAPLAALVDGPVQITVFEDGVPGMQAARLAVDHLQRAGLDITFQGIGVSTHADKRAALAQVAGQVVSTVNEGLDIVLQGC